MTGVFVVGIFSLMILKTCELISIFLLIFVSGMYWGPWLALSRSMRTFEPDIFLSIAHRMDKNMAQVMTFLVPISLVAAVPVLVLSFSQRPVTFYLGLVGLSLFLITLFVTLLIEVPIVKKIRGWELSSLPNNWQELRDRWGAFHYFRIIPSIVGLALFLIGAIF